MMDIGQILVRLLMSIIVIYSFVDWFGTLHAVGLIFAWSLFVSELKDILKENKPGVRNE